MNNSDTKNTRKTFTRSLIAAVVIGAISLPVAAGKNRNMSNYDNATFDYARVVSVDPLIETYQVNQPIEQCWDERVSTRQRYPQNLHPKNKSRTPEVLGAIIGGLIGNQVGKRGGGKARDVATVAGAILGGSIGHDVKNNNRRNHDRYDERYQTARYQTVQRCEVTDSYVTKEQIVGYDVAYKYRGNVYHTEMNQHPGDKIKVKVTVNPV
ncbi:MAG: glycine zipper 2TM domain-containing protein [Arenicella sp.]|nr:glycine zipper 2TM domain-containing protein [Arenicella sp.]